MLHLPRAVSPRVRGSSVALLASFLAACSAPQGSGDSSIGQSSSSIVKGTASGEEDDGIVEVFVAGVGLCTGTLIAPNVVLTALHCVSAFNPDAPFSCKEDGTIVPQLPGAGEIGNVIDAARIEIRLGINNQTAPPPDAHGERIFSSISHNICTNDIAAIVLDTMLSPAPRPIRLMTPTARGELVTAVGYGDTATSPEDTTATRRVRNRISGLRVLAVGEFGSYPKQGTAAPRTLVVGEGPCHGDSGGPALSEKTGAVTGVYSLGAASGCVGPSARNVFTQTAAFESLIRQATDYAGTEVLPEEVDQPSGGTGGDTGAGGAQQTGGSAMGGSASAGFASGGSHATGGSSSAEGGTDAVNPGTGGIQSEGSGSRKDPSCTCRFESLGSSRSAAWVGVISILATALLRRRRR